MKITKSLQQKLEDIFKVNNYIVRYERGNFKGGFCVLEDTKVIIVNKFFPLEAKVNTLFEVLKQFEIIESKLSTAQLKLSQEIRQTEIQF